MVWLGVEPNATSPPANPGDLSKSNFRSKMESRRQGRGDAGVLKQYVEEPMTKPTMIAL